MKLARKVIIWILHKDIVFALNVIIIVAVVRKKLQNVNLVRDYLDKITNLNVPVNKATMIMGHLIVNVKFKAKFII